jgi:predicted TIM-barrel fold metal-dependent hydrolase
MIIDIHNNVGEDVVFEYSQKIDEILFNMNKFGIDFTFITPFPEMDYKSCNNVVSNIVKENSEKVLGFMCVNPSDAEGYSEIDRAYKELGLRGLLLDIEAYGLDLSRGIKTYSELIEKASGYDIPIIINSQDIWTGGTDGLNLKRKEALSKILLKYPESKIVVNPHFPGCTELAKKHRNLYIETSGGSGFRLVNEVGARKVLFSSNAPRFHPKLALDYIKYIKFKPYQREMILGGNAENIFGNLL